MNFIKALIRFYIKFMLMCLTILIATAICHAHDEDGGWFCETQSSKFVDGVWSVCGVAESMSEQGAREQALKAAYSEFKLNHPASGHYEIESGRTDCTSKSTGYKCVRMVKLYRSGPSQHKNRL